jgi:hypothetical protein
MRRFSAKRAAQPLVVERGAFGVESPAVEQVLHRHRVVARSEAVLFLRPVGFFHLDPIDDELRRLAPMPAPLLCTVLSAGCRSAAKLKSSKPPRMTNPFGLAVRRGGRLAPPFGDPEE